MPGRVTDPDRRPRRLPAAVRDECRRRHRELVALADAPLIDLGDAAAVAPASGTARSAVGVLALACADDPMALLVRARAGLAPGGRLLLFEPYRPARWAGRLAHRAAPTVRAFTGVRVDLPVPVLVRDAGFVIATIERVTMPTPIAPLRSFCLVVTCPVDEDRLRSDEVVASAGVRP